MNDLQKSYDDFIKSKNYSLKQKSAKSIRFATYNIHCWTDTWEKNTMKNIIQDIKYIDADLIFLQEVIFGSIYKVKGKKINTEKIIGIMEKMGYFVFFCNTLPNWYSGIYGNMLCVKNKYVKKLNITSFTFEKPTEKCMVRENLKGGDESRCFIQVELGNYIIIGTHLDVCSEIIRKKQIKKILSVVNNTKNRKKKAIILGDFNTTNLNQYDSVKSKKNIMKHVFKNSRYLSKNNVFNTMINNNFISATEKLNINLTVWSNIQCDYIFTRGINNFKPQILYTPNSDHLPLIIDIKDNHI